MPAHNATHVLAGFVSTGQQTLRLSKVTGMTLDNVEVRMRSIELGS